MTLNESKEPKIAMAKSWKIKSLVQAYKIFSHVAAADISAFPYLQQRVFYFWSLSVLDHFNTANSCVTLWLTGLYIKKNF